MGEQSLGDLCLAATTMVLVLIDSGLYENNTGPLDSIIFESLTVLVCNWGCLNKNAPPHRLIKSSITRTYGLVGESVTGGRL